MAAAASVVRLALLLALAGLAAILAWIGIAGVNEGLPGREIVLGLALFPAAALVLRAMKGRVGAVVALVVAGISAFVGVALSFCLCSAPLLPASVAILIASGIVAVLAVIDMLIGLFFRGGQTGDGSAP